MHDGHTSITVNSYMGKLDETKIGRVYVEDLDDWDLGDKTFIWKNQAPGFDVSTSGEVCSHPLFTRLCSPMMRCLIERIE